MHLKFSQTTEGSWRLRGNGFQWGGQSLEKLQFILLAALTYSDGIRSEWCILQWIFSLSAWKPHQILSIQVPPLLSRSLPCALLMGYRLRVLASDTLSGIILTHSSLELDLWNVPQSSNGLACNCVAGGSPFAMLTKGYIQALNSHI